MRLRTRRVHIQTPGQPSANGAEETNTARGETRNLSAAHQRLLTVRLHIDLLWPGDIFAALVFILTLNQPKDCVIQVANKHLSQVYVLLE